MEHDSQFESLDPEEIGIAEEAPLPLRFRAAARWSPVVMSFPHVGLRWPAELGPKPQADFPRNADYEVHTLFPFASRLGIATIEASYSRLVVDLNRSDDDVSAELVPDHPAPLPRRRPGFLPGPGESHGHRWDRPGRGVVWAAAIGRGTAPVPMFEPPIPYPRFRQRIEHYHRPYYRALETLLERRRRRFGFAILVDGHSMPGSVDVDLVLGTLDGTTCSARLVQFSRTALSTPQASGPLLSVRVDDPYHGGEIIRRFGKPETGVHAFQLEVNRRLYMNERRQSLLPRAETGPAGEATQPRRTRPLGELLARLEYLMESLVSQGHVLGLQPAQSGLGSAAE